MIAIEEVVVPVVLDIVRRKEPGATTVDLDARLVADLGLRSLDLAEIVAVLEQQTDYDPFAEDVSITSVRTVKDLCSAYSREGFDDGAGEADLEAIRAKAAERR